MFARTPRAAVQGAWHCAATMITDNRQKLGGQAVNLGLAANVVLAVVKTTIGVIGHSKALLADGINSTSDVAYFVVVKIFLALARKPADEEHPYGHTQMESIAAVVVGSFVLTTAIAIFWDAINNTFDLITHATSTSTVSVVALWVAIVTVVVKIFLTIITKRVGRSTQNAAIVALAYDHRNDVLSASGAAIGIYLGRSGYPWVDPLAGAVVAVVILRTGIEILRQSSASLMDTIPGDPLNKQIREEVSSVPGVAMVEEIRAHRFGPYIMVNITIAVDGALSVFEGDGIASDVERRLVERIDYLRHVYVHYHPAKR